jgi:lipopolysaccharide/colanic/teichoic acid biosynthesis glycosyltransferase
LPRATLQNERRQGAEERLFACTEWTFPDPRQKGVTDTRVLLVGMGALAIPAVEELRSAGSRFCLVGAIDPHPKSEFLGKFPDLPRLDGAAGFEALILDYCIDEVHLALPAKSAMPYLSPLRSACRELGIPLVLTLGMFEDSEEPDEAPGSGFAAPVRAEFNRHPAIGTWRTVVKRAIDLVVASLAGLLLLPVFAVIAIAVLATSRGPVIFSQQRIGRGRRKFQMFKFRTMIANAEELRVEMEAHNDARGASFKLFNDPRVTAVGGLLRRFSLDELPQLFNVLRGDMSLIGPRPIPVWVGERLNKREYFRRFRVQPGMSGLWQVRGRTQDFDLMATQDLYFVDHWSLGLELTILAQTIPAVVKADGAH